MLPHIQSDSEKNMEEINERYFPNRWRKDVFRRHSRIFFMGGYPNMTDEYKKFMELQNTFNQCADLALDAPTKRQFLKQRLEAIENELLDMNGIVNEETNVNGITGNRNGNDAGKQNLKSCSHGYSWEATYQSDKRKKGRKMQLKE